jgi:MoxR-like ATPase
MQPKVLSSFVRNRLIDEVYLPLIGANLAKQLGAAGEGKRTDRMGMLLLMSPPGYGKTTLMEYVADRLGLIFVKVNGPALGHGVTSLDPAEAPNATARQEVEKISFALEMGNNVLLYLDDIQHTSPELLQKFISLCDAQRRMEGVWDGGTRTYDLRGKRFAVCMAGNPYTETGRRFRVPDMLANRADVWNLGDVLAGREDLFELSYLENALTSNAVLAPLSSRDRADLPLLMRLADGDDTVRPDQLGHPYSAAELDQILSVLRKMRRVQRIVLRTNRAYIASAGQADASRTEPPFRLQGSYRNMNKLAERIVPVMNDEEIEGVVDDHYLGEAQTLASGAEANLLKLAELRGRLTAEQAARWADVKAAYLRERALGGAGDDPMTRAVGAVGLLADRVGGVEAAIGRLRDA